MTKKAYLKFLDTKSFFLVKNKFVTLNYCQIDIKTFFCILTIAMLKKRLYKYYYIRDFNRNFISLKYKNLIV